MYIHHEKVKGFTEPQLGYESWYASTARSASICDALPLAAVVLVVTLGAKVKSCLISASVPRLPEFLFGASKSSFNQILSAGSLYVHTEFTSTIPTSHVCADAREMQTNTQNTPKSRMQHTPRAFIHIRIKMRFIRKIKTTSCLSHASSEALHAAHSYGCSRHSSCTKTKRSKQSAQHRT
jgi:hypothetical protein